MPFAFFLSSLSKLYVIADFTEKNEKATSHPYVGFRTKAFSEWTLLLDNSSVYGLL